MSIAVVFALGAMLAGSLSDFTYKGVAARGIRASTFLFYQTCTFFAVLAVIALPTGQFSKFSTPALIYGPVLGAVNYFGILLFIMSLKQGKATVHAPIFRLSFVLTSVLAVVVLNESVTLPKVAGVLLAATGIVSLADVGGLRQGFSERRRSLAYLLGATLIFGVTGAMTKEAFNQGASPAPLLLVQSASFTVVAFVRVLLAGELRPSGAILRLAPLVAMLQLAWAMLLFLALEKADASVAYPIVQLSFVVTAVLAVVFYREALSKRLVIGLAAAVLAVVALALA